MVDASAILRALRLGYDFVEDCEGMFWLSKANKVEGPFYSMDSAAYAALDQHYYGDRENSNGDSSGGDSGGADRASKG